MMKITLSLILLFSTQALIAYTGNSLTWQKLALEEKIQRKFNFTLTSILKDNQYLVEVDAEVTEPPAPNFGDNGPKTGPRVSDLALEESRGDYIAFSKMGLEVPVLEKFLDEDRTKLNNLYKFNETYDLFKNLSAITVTVFLSDKIPQDLQEIVKKLIQSSKFNVSGIKPAIKFETIAMEWVDPAKLKPVVAKKEEPKKKPEQVEPKIWAKDWLEWASRWGNAVGLILCAVIIGYIAMSLFKQWKEFMEKAMAKKSAETQSEEKKDEDKDQAMASMAMAPNSDPTQEEEVISSQGIERFQQCLEQHPDESINMIREWLVEDSEISTLTLRGIAQQVTAAEMEKLMNGLSDSQRDKWKSLLGKHLEPKELAAANNHLFQGVVQSFLVPSKIKDGELLNLIMDLTVASSCEFLKANKNHTGVLLNLLSPSFVSRILAEVDNETADNWLMTASSVNAKTIDEFLPGLKESLMKYKESNQPSPFILRMMAMIPTSSPSREGNLFRALAKAGNTSMVFDVAKKHFPSELVMDLPAPFLKEVIQSYPMAKRVELIYSKPEAERASFLDMIAETGTPARDMIDLEIENIARDIQRSADIEQRSDEIWNDFVKLSRTSLAKNTSFAGTVDRLLQDWSSKLKSGLKSINGGKAA